MTTINKGDTIAATWLDARFVGLAGVQMKLGAQWREVSGIVRHVRGDHPTSPTTVRLYVDAEGGTVTPYGCTCGPHIEVDPKHVTAVTKPAEATR